MKNSPIMTLEEVATFLQLGERTVYDMARKGRIPCKKIASQWRFSREAVVKWFGSDSSQMQATGRETGAGILVVEDNEETLEIICSYLKSTFSAQAIIGAKDGVQALVEVGRSKPALVVLDIGIPQMDGLEVCRLLKQDPKTSPIIIVAISGVSDPQLEGEALGSGAEAFFRKPLKLEKFAQYLEQLLTRQSYKG